MSRRYRDVGRRNQLTHVLILNAGYEPLHRVGIRHAIRMLVREVAVVEESYENKTFGPYPLPKVLRLVKYVAMKWRNRAPKWTRNRLLQRDDFRCGYCEKKATTIDHIVPVARGGKTTWMNTVAACWSCNNRKGSLSPREAGMPLRFQPQVPSWWVGYSHKGTDTERIHVYQMRPVT